MSENVWTMIWGVAVGLAGVAVGIYAFRIAEQRQRMEVESMERVMEDAGPLKLVLEAYRNICASRWCLWLIKIGGLFLIAMGAAFLCFIGGDMVRYIRR